VKEKTVVIVGTAKYVNRLDLGKLEGVETVACNRILMHKSFRPDHLVIADRRPYIPELQAGRLEEYAKQGGKVYLSKTLWDRKISCASTPVQRRPKWKHKEFALAASRSKLNWVGFKKPFCSCANTGIALFQFAVAFGATRIGVTGIGLVPPVKDQSGHFYGKDSWGQNPSPERAYLAAERVRNELRAKGIKVYNLSLENAAMEELFGRYGFGRFCEETKQ